MEEDIFIRLVQMAKERDITVYMSYSWRPDLYYLDFQRNQWTGGVVCWRVPINGARFIGTTEEEKKRMLLEILEKAEKNLCPKPESQNAKEETWN